MNLFNQAKRKQKKRRRLNAVQFYFAWAFGLTLLTVAFRMTTWFIYWNMIAPYIGDEHTIIDIALRICSMFLPPGMVFLSAIVQYQLIHMRTGRRLRGWYIRTMGSIVLCLACFYIPPIILGFCLGWALVSILFMFSFYVPAVILASIAQEKPLRNLVDVTCWHRIRYYIAWNCVGLLLFFIAPEEFYVLGLIMPLLIYSAVQAVLMLWVLHNSTSRDFYYFPPQRQ